MTQLIETVLCSRPKGKAHWSRCGLAVETGLSKTTVRRYLSLFGVQPHRSCLLRALRIVPKMSQMLEPAATPASSQVQRDDARYHSSHVSVRPDLG